MPPLVLDGSAGISGVDGTASNPAIEGTDSNTGIFYPAADTWAVATGGTEALRVNSSQQLGLGVTSPAAKLDLNTGGASNTMARFTSNGSYYSYILSSNVTSVLSSDTSGNTGYAIRGGSNQLEMYTNGSESARITSSGNFAIGTTTTTNFGNRGLYVSGNVGGYSAVSIGASGGGYGVVGYGVGFTNTDGTYKALASDSLSWIRFQNGAFEFWRQTSATAGTNYTGTQGMTLDANGDFLVGTTSKINSSAFTLQKNITNNNICVMDNTTGSSPYGMQVRYSGQDPNNTGSYYFEAYNAFTGVYRFYVRSNGGISNYTANNVGLSDRREKTNFAPAKNYLDIICAIPVQTFNYIDQNMEEDPGLTLGVIAQDVQEVAPEFVHESDWGTPDNPKMRLGVYETDMMFALMKSIQELNTKVEAQAAEIAALKGNA